MGVVGEGKAIWIGHNIVLERLPDLHSAVKAVGVRPHLIAPKRPMSPW